MTPTVLALLRACVEEIASAIGWRLDPEQAWVTGQVIGVDGGLSRVRPRS